MLMEDYLILSERMEVEKATPKSDALQQLSYSELKKMAKKHGIKGNMKAEKIIAVLCSLSSDDMKSFSTPVQKEINSSRKNKEKKFDEDVMTPLATPRRGTYSLESPTDSISAETEEAAVISTTCDDTSALDMSNVTINRGSERKLRRRVSFQSPMRAQSTPKNSNIKLRPKTPIAPRTPLKRVSFSTPAREQKIKSSERSLRLTPHPRKSSEKSLHATPRLRHSFNEEYSVLNAGTPKKTVLLPSVTELPEKQDVTPSVKKSQSDDKSILNAGTPKKTVLLPSVMELPEKQDVTSSVKKYQSDDKSILKSDDVAELNAKALVPEFPEKQYITRSVKQSQKDSNKSCSTVSRVSKDEASAKKKRAATPNFKKIHEKAFEKMESIDDYQKRKAQNSQKKISQRPNLKTKVMKGKSKIPAFSGIPFIPSSISTSSNVCKTLNFEMKAKDVDSAVGKETIGKETKKDKKNCENIQKKDKAKFDLKKSLSRKLGYIPYKGPLKPLAESNILNTTSTSCFHNQKEPVNKVINSNRLKNRSTLKGVRTNKRFELQMRNRNLK